MNDPKNPYRMAGTGKLTALLIDDDTGELIEVEYLPYPHSDPQGRAVWLVQLELADNRHKRFGLAINDEVILGRRSSDPNVIDLGPFDATRMGVSRHHLKLQPTPTALYIIDLGSTNGTLRNGQSIGVNTPYGLVNGDTVTLGRLKFIIRIIERPSSIPVSIEQKADLADALSQVAKAITSQLELDGILQQMLETAMALTKADESSIWLVDEQTGTLFLEAEQGIEDEGLRRMRLPLSDNTMAGQVFINGEPLRANRQKDGEKLKISQRSPRGVEAIIYTPLKLGNSTFGVLSAAHDQPDRKFSERDERVLIAIADFAAIAISNARLFQQLENERMTIHATIDTLPQPLIILDENNTIVISNKVAKVLLENYAVELIEGLRGSMGRTAELTLGEQTYITTSEHVPSVGTIVVMQDITYVKQLEHDRAEMIHALSHDMKGPLMSIKGWAYMMPKINDLSDAGQEFVTRIDESVERMVDMISHLLNTARMADATDLEVEDCNLVELSEQIIADIEGAALTKSVKLALSVTGEPFIYPGDAAKLYHMGLNLVDNAIKYTYENTTVYVSLDFQPHQVVFSVADEGPGIPPDELDRVFDKYFRGSAQKKRTTGVGLGLSVVEAVASAHQGTVNVANGEAGGAVFSVVLPV